MPLPFPFDFKNPDYIQVLEWRLERYERLIKKPDKIPKLQEFYRDNPAQFIIDWGMTVDPRNVERGLPAVVPFFLFEFQEEWVNWFVDCWRNQKPAVTAKSREMGVSWLSTSLAATLCLFNQNMTIGFGSRKEIYVDDSKTPGSLLHNVRFFVSKLPSLFCGGWDEKKHSHHMRVLFPETSSAIIGEAGDNLFRGKRLSIAIIDESAWLLRPELAEASLSSVTNCRHDISTPRGMANPFARKVHNAGYEKRLLHWRLDPRKNQAWYDKKCAEIDDPVVIAQELDLDFSASQEGILIPAEWVQSSVNAHEILGITPSGVRKAGLDIADEGRDLNALCGRHGVLLEYLESWSGKGSDTFATAEKAYNRCVVLGYNALDFDADGIGAYMRGDARVLNEGRENKIDFGAFRGSGEVVDPDNDPLHKPGTPKDPKKSRTNADFFANRKAQAWWSLRRRFQITYRAVTAKRKNDIYDFSHEDIISISSSVNELQKLLTELSQPTYVINNAGKIIVEKMPDGARSPNLADAAMIAFAPEKKRARGFFDA